MPPQPDREMIGEAVRQAGLVPVYSCCGVTDKYCSADLWRGNLEGFAGALLRLARQADPPTPQNGD